MIQRARQGERKEERGQREQVGKSEAGASGDDFLFFWLTLSLMISLPPP